jgi:hypothetical protein
MIVGACGHDAGSTPANGGGDSSTCTGAGCSCATGCDDGNPCTDDACTAQGGCTHQPNTAACDDGDSCTTPDACSAGVCIGGAVAKDGACKTQPRAIDRSLGVAAKPAPLAESTGTLTIKGTTAIFTQAIADNVGVGDVIQYATDDGAPNALAFIHSRLSSTAYGVRTNVGDTPKSVVTSKWSIFRAYSSLASAVNTAVRSGGLPQGGTENALIDASLRDFDAFVGGKDITAGGDNQIWNVACYDDGVADDLLVHIDTPWVTDATHYLRVFTPTNATEVGTSQRHTGKWGAGYRRTHSLHLWDHSTRIEGIALQQARTMGGAADPGFDNRTYIVHTGSKGSDIRMSDCYGRMTNPAEANRTFDLYEDGGNGSGVTTLQMWNNIGISDGGAGSGAFLVNTRASLTFSNCTGIGTAAAAGFYMDSVTGAKATVVNSIGYSASGQAFHVVSTALPFTVKYSASNDATLTNTTINGTPADNNHPSQTFTFVNPGTDYHLISGANLNLGILGVGENLTAQAGLSADIDGQPRPAPPAGWDLGADQVR